MVKKRNAGKSNFTGEGYAASNEGYVGGGGGNNGKFSVFEFAGDELRVETESRKTLAKFGNKRSPVDKYVFLASLTTQQKDSVGEVFDVDATDDPSQNDTNGKDMILSFGSLNFDYPCSFLKQQDYECSLSHTKSHGPGSWKLGGYTTSKKHNKLDVDSEEDGWINLGSSSSFDLAEREGSSKKKSSEYEANNNDCEAVVVISPLYVKYENKHYTSCCLIFSQRCIRLVTPQGERNRTHCLEWSTIDIVKIEHQQCESANADVVNVFLNSNVIDVTDAGNWSSGTEQLEFVVGDDSEWHVKLAEIKLLDLKYEAAWETIKDECKFDESFGGIIYPDGDPDAVFISRKDIELLQPRTFINDTIIDFYIKHLVNNSKTEKQHSFHFFNTFFFQKLLDMDRDLRQNCENGSAYQRVRKWTRNINIFEKDYIFIPVNFSLHWSLIVICHPGEVANSRVEEQNNLIRMPCILHMDSIRGSHGGLENLIRRYLWEEWKEWGYKQEEGISKTFWNLDFIALQVPQQENLFDCGLFLLHYAELFLKEDLDAIKYVKSSLNQDWFLAAEVSLKKRDHIKKLVYEIAKDRQNHNEVFQSDGRNQRENESSDEFEIKELQSISDMLEDNRLVNKDNFQHDKLLVPTDQFPSMTLPMEDTIGNQKESLPTGDHRSSRYEAGGDKDPIPEHYPLTSYESRKSKVSRETSSRRSPIIIDVQNDDCVLEVASSFERQQTSHSTSPMSISDLETCVVEDSEEECETESIRRARKPTYLIQ